MQINDEPRWRPAARALSRKRSLRAGIVQLLYVGGAVGLGLLITPLEHWRPDSDLSYGDTPGGSPRARSP